MTVLESLRRILGLSNRGREVYGARRRGNDSSKLEEEGSEVDPLDPFPEPVRLEAKDVLDLHAFAPRDVERVVVAYLEEARLMKFRQVRIIHGKGVGVQREAVRRILSLTPFVESFSDAPPEAGGWGATVARLRVDA